MGTRKKSMQSRMAFFLAPARHVIVYAAVSHKGVRVHCFQSEIWHTALTWCHLIKQCHWDSGPSWMTWEESFCTEKFLHTASFCSASFCTSYTVKPLHTEAITRSKLLHWETFTHSKLLHMLHREALAQRSFYRASFSTENFYTQQAFAQKFLHTKLALTQRGSCTGKLLHKASS